MGRSGRGEWAVVVLAIGIPLAWVAVFTTLAIAVDTDSATSACSYLAAGTWLAALLLHTVHALPETLAGRADSFDARLVGFAFAGVLASIAFVLLARADVVDMATGITGEAVVGSFGLAALLWAMLHPLGRL